MEGRPSGGSGVGVPLTVKLAGAGAWLAIPVASTLLVLAVAAGLGPPALALAVIAAGALWSLRDIRVAYLVAVLLASFVSPSGGHLTRELSVVYGWLTWCAVVTLWRGGWQPTTWPPRPVVVAVLLWTAVCVFGALVGLGVHNNLRYLGLEFAGAAWPLVALFVCQVQDRRTLPLAAAGLALVALAHTAFGLVWLKILHQRLGGVYFTTVPGFVAVGLWAVVLLAPRARVRWAAYALLVPMLTHQLFSFTRGYWLGILSGVAVVTALAWRGGPRLRARDSLRRLGVLFGSVLVVLATVLASVQYFGQGALLEWAGKRFQSSFSVQASSETASNIMRLLEYSLAIDAARGSPVVGRGFGYLITNQNPFTGARFPQGVIHNVYLFLWLKLGVVGLAAFAFLMWRVVQATAARAHGQSDWRVRAWLLGAAGMTVQSLVICLTNYSLIDFCTGIFLAYVWGTAFALMSSRAAA
jgi:hypothetical protein